MQSMVDENSFIHQIQRYSLSETSLSDTDLSVAGVVDAVDALHVAWERPVKGRHPQLSHEE